MGDLRYCLTQAANSPGASTIDLTALRGKIDLGAALPDLGNVTVRGPGASALTIERAGGGDYSIFTVDSGKTASITGLTLANGSATNGGGVYVANSATLTLDADTLANNSATSCGGGVYEGFYATLTVSNSTLTGNSADYEGGGICECTSATLTVSNSTLAGNSADYDGGGICKISSRATATLGNTLLAGNTAPGGPAVWGAASSQGYNLIDKTDGSSGWTSTDLQGTVAAPLDAKLGPLQDNGGPTQTMLPLVGSPAVDAGGSANASATDQRGLPRVVAARADIGAVEVQPGTAVNMLFGGPSVASAGTPVYVTVLFHDAYGHLAGTDTVRFISTDGRSVLPANYTLTPADGGTSCCPSR